MSTTETIDEAARDMAGNWKRFQCFAWSRLREIESPEDWAIYYTSDRDSRLLDQANEKVILEAMEPYTEGDDPDCVMESHGHWAVGHVDGFSIRVYRSGQITQAFRTLHELMERMDNYPILNDELYSQMEYDATWENLDDAVWRVKHEYELPEGWKQQAWDWLWDHNCLESRDDQGGYPSEDKLRECFDALEFPRAED